MFAERSTARSFALVFGVAYLAIALIETVVGGVSDGELTGPGWVFAGGLPGVPDRGSVLHSLVVERGLDVNQILLLEGGLHNLIHFATGIVLLGAWVVGGTLVQLVAKVFGVVYVLVVILGLVAPGFTMNLIGYDLDGVPDLSVPIAYTIDHALIGIGGIYAGFLAAPSAEAPPVAAA